MTWPLVIQRIAKRDIADAIRWYDRQRAGLGDEFESDLDAAFQRLQNGPPFVAPIYREVRFAKLQRFPFVVYFRQQPDRIEVLAVLHAKRDPKILQQRAQKIDSRSGGIP